MIEKIKNLFFFKRVFQKHIRLADETFGLYRFCSKLFCLAAEVKFCCLMWLPFFILLSFVFREFLNFCSSFSWFYLFFSFLWFSHFFPSFFLPRVFLFLVHLNNVSTLFFFLIFLTWVFPGHFLFFRLLIFLFCVIITQFFIFVLLTKLRVLNSCPIIFLNNFFQFLFFYFFLFFINWNILSFIFIFRKRIFLI